MTPGSGPWVVRSLRDWALGVRQGMALVTYRSGASRGLVLRDLTLELQGEKWKAETLECGECTAEEFVSRIARSKADALFVLDPDRLLFGESGDKSPFWVNFQRETLVAHPGVQIWWMLPNAAIRFGKQLPDLSRFFLLREDLKDGAEIDREPSLELQIPTDSRFPGDPDRARDLLQRALRAAANPDTDPARVWLDLGISAIDEFLRSGQPDEGLDALRQLTGAAGAPGEVLSPGLFARASGDLGMALLTLSRLYREVGRRDDALAAAEDAVRVYRQLEPTGGGTFQGELGKALGTLAVEFSRLGRREEALERAEEAVHIFRQLEQAHPGALSPDLASSLGTLTAISAMLGRNEEAVARGKEAVDILRKLAQLRPGAFLPALSGSLNNLSTTLSQLGRREEALGYAREAVDIRRQLARKLPDAFLPALGMSVGNLANRLSELGNWKEASANAEEAVQIFRRLANEHPGAFLPDLARSLLVHGRILAQDRPREALPDFEEAIRLLAALLSELPNAYAPLVRTILAAYLQTAQSAGADPDRALLAPVNAILEKLGSG